MSHEMREKWVGRKVYGDLRTVNLRPLRQLKLSEYCQQGRMIMQRVHRFQEWSQWMELRQAIADGRVKIVQVGDTPKEQVH